MSLRSADSSAPRVSHTSLTARVPTAVLKRIEQLAIAENRPLEHYLVLGLRGILANRALREWEARRRDPDEAA